MAHAVALSVPLVSLIHTSVRQIKMAKITSANAAEKL
jgi:hypothetical protein